MRNRSVFLPLTRKDQGGFWILNSAIPMAFAGGITPVGPAQKGSGIRRCFNGDFVRGVFGFQGWDKDETNE
jgi:hypothetical protein